MEYFSKPIERVVVFSLVGIIIALGLYLYNVKSTDTTTNGTNRQSQLARNIDSTTIDEDSTFKSKSVNTERDVDKGDASLVTNDFQDENLYEYEDSFDPNSSPLFTKDLIVIGDKLKFSNAQKEILENLVLQHIEAMRLLSAKQHQLYSTYGLNASEEDISLIDSQKVYQAKALEDSINNHFSPGERAALREYEQKLIKRNRTLALTDIANYVERFVPNLGSTQKKLIEGLINELSLSKLDSFPIGATFQEAGSSPESLNFPEDQILYREFKERLRELFTDDQKQVFDHVKYF